MTAKTNKEEEKKQKQMGTPLGGTTNVKEKGKQQNKVKEKKEKKNGDPPGGYNRRCRRFNSAGPRERKVEK